MFTLWWTNIAMENHHAINGTIHYVYGHFPLLFVCSPEGKPPFSYGFPMVFLWFSYGFPMVFPFKPPFSYGKPLFLAQHLHSPSRCRCSGHTSPPWASTRTPWRAAPDGRRWTNRRATSWCPKEKPLVTWGSLPKFGEKTWDLTGILRTYVSIYLYIYIYTYTNIDICI